MAAVGTQSSGSASSRLWIVDLQEEVEVSQIRRELDEAGLEIAARGAVPDLMVGMRMLARGEWLIDRGVV